MRIAVLIDTWLPFIGGGQINAWEISKRLSQKGQKVEIITRNCGKDNLKDLRNLKVTKLGALSKTGDEIARFSYLWQASAYLKRNNFDLVIAHAFLPGLIAKLFMIIKKKPAILVVHGTSIGTGLNNGPKASLEKFILTKIKYSAEITVSRDFLKIKNVNKIISYIPNGVDPIFFKSLQPVKRTKKSLLFVGRLHPQKNLSSLVAAINLLSQEKFPVKLTIVGDGPQKQPILSQIKHNGLESSIKMEGSQYGSDLAKYYQSNQAFILPSIYEGQALTILEAWASKMPVIVSKTGDNLYLVKEGANGYFIDNQSSPKSIAKAIKKALGNNNLNKLGQNGYEFVKNNFSWDISADKTLKFVKRLNK